MSYPFADWCPQGVLPDDFPWQSAYCACTDGSGNTNTSIGAWAFVARLHTGQALSRSAACSGTTNNRMELEAAIQALEAARARPVIIVCDSQYVVQGAALYLPNWRKRGWIASSGKPVSNVDLWERLDEAQSFMNRYVVYHHVRGHRGHPGNEAADKLCTKTVNEFVVSLLTPT